MKLELARRRQVEPGHRRVPALRVRAGILNRQLHVGAAQLRDDRSVDELDHRMHDRLRMNQHVDVACGQIEQPVRLDHLEPFVHERRRIDGDLAAHAPGRMLQGGCRLRALEGAGRRFSGRPPRCRQDDAAYVFLVSAVQALMNSVVLAVDRQKRHAVRARGCGDERARHHQHLFVGQRDRLSRIDRRKHRFEPRGAGRRANHDVHVWMGGDRDQTLRAGRGLFCAVTLRHRAQRVFAGHRHNGRLKFERLLKQQIGIGAGSEPNHAKLVGMRAHDIQSALPD